MNFAEALEAHASVPTGRRCGLCEALIEHPEAEQIWAAIESDTYAVPVVRRALNDAGIQIGDESVRRHRIRECRTRGLL